MVGKVQRLTDRNLLMLICGYTSQSTTFQSWPIVASEFLTTGFMVQIFFFFLPKRLAFQSILRTLMDGGGGLMVETLC